MSIEPKLENQNDSDCNNTLALLFHLIILLLTDFEKFTVKMKTYFNENCSNPNNFLINHPREKMKIAVFLQNTKSILRFRIFNVLL